MAPNLPGIGMTVARCDYYSRLTGLLRTDGKTDKQHGVGDGGTCDEHDVSAMSRCIMHAHCNTAGGQGGKRQLH